MFRGPKTTLVQNGYLWGWNISGNFLGDKAWAYICLKKICVLKLCKLFRHSTKYCNNYQGWRCGTLHMVNGSTCVMSQPFCCIVPCFQTWHFDITGTTFTSNSNLIRLEADITNSTTWLRQEGFLLRDNDYRMKCAILRGCSTRVPLGTNRRISIEASWLRGRTPGGAHRDRRRSRHLANIPRTRRACEAVHGVGAGCPIASYFHDTITDKPHTCSFQTFYKIISSKGNFSWVRLIIH